MTERAETPQEEYVERQQIAFIALMLFFFLTAGIGLSTSEKSLPPAPSPIVSELRVPLSAVSLPNCDGITHHVAPGNTVSAIAAIHQITPETITQANGLTDPNLIYVGQQLCIPTSQAGEVLALATNP